MEETNYKFCHYFRWEGGWWYWLDNNPKGQYRPGAVAVGIYNRLSNDGNHQLAKDCLSEMFPDATLHRARPYHEGGNWKGPSMGSRPYKVGHRNGDEVVTIRGYETDEEAY
jgi:hypothetical protein